MSNTIEKMKLVLTKSRELAEQLEVQDAIEEIDNASGHLKRGQFYVLVCGEVKRGKSTLVNTFLNEPDLCPVGDQVTTQAISVISWSEQERIVAHRSFYDDDEKLVKQDKVEILRNEIAIYQKPKRKGSLRVVTELFEISINNDRLKGGLTLVDSPGVGGLNPKHAAVTAAFLSSADAAICVGDAITPLSKTEINFFKKVGEVTKKILLVTTHSDEGDADLISANSFSSLKEVIGDNKCSIKAYPLSSKLMSDYRENGDQTAYDFSGFADFESGMVSISNDGETLLCARTAGVLIKECYEMREPLAIELDASQNNVGGLKDELEERINHLNELRENEATWMNHLIMLMEKVENENSRFLSEQFDELLYLFDQYLDDDDLLNSNSAFESQIITDLTLVSSRVAEKLENDTNGAYVELKKRTGIGRSFWHSFEYKATLKKGIPDASSTSNMDKVLIVGKTIGRIGAVSGVMGGIVGGIIGTFVAPGGGTVIGAQIGAQIVGGLGALTGTIVGLLKSKEIIAQKKREEIRKVATPMLNQNKMELQHALKNASLECKNALVEKFRKDIKNEISNVKAKIDGIKRGLAAKKSRIVELQIIIQRLDNILNECIEVMNYVNAKSRTEEEKSHA